MKSRKSMGRALVWFFGLACLPFLVLVSNESEEVQNPWMATKKSTILWKGEVTGVYKNRIHLKIKVFRNQKITKLDRGVLEGYFEENKEYPVFQKDTHTKIGDFFLREVLWEEQRNAQGKRDLEIVLRGDFLKKDERLKSPVEISTDCYIASLGEKDFYVESGSFFKGRNTPPKSKILHPRDRKEMVLIPRSLFLYGQGTDPTQDSFNPNFMNLKLSTIPELKSYYIDKYEVTNREYANFLEKTNSNPPPHWMDGKIPQGEEDFPVHSLTYREVEAYAAWSGKRIPTEWEWEKAAKGSGVIATTERDETLRFEIHSTKYPFGEEYDPLFCNTRESGKKKLISVYDFPEESASPYGVIGMCGNASEWTSSTYEVYPGHFLRSFAFGKQFRVVRGGSFADSAKQSTVYARAYGGLPNLSEDRRAGFRLVWDLPD